MSVDGEPPGVTPTVVLPACRYPQLLDRDRWREHGFLSAADSDLWSDRACGVARVAMILDLATAQPASVVDLLP